MADRKRGGRRWRFKEIIIALMAVVLLGMYIIPNQFVAAKDGAPPQAEEGLAAEAPDPVDGGEEADTGSPGDQPQAPDSPAAEGTDTGSPADQPQAPEDPADEDGVNDRVDRIVTPSAASGNDGTGSGEISEEEGGIAAFSVTYLVSFLDQTGKVVYSYQVNQGDPVSGPPQAVAGQVTPAGMTLDYWYEKDDAGVPPSKFSFYDEDASSVASGDLYLKPWFKELCYVLFISSGTQVAPYAVTSGTSVDAPADPTRAGYIFNGWLANNGTSFSFPAVITGDTVLVADWLPDEASYSVAVWLEKAGFSGTPNPGVPGNLNFTDYDYICTVTAGLPSGIPGQLSGLTLGALPASVAGLFSPTASTAFPNGLLKYAEPQYLADREIQGNGKTVINLFAKRKVYEYTFRFPTASDGTGIAANYLNGWYMTVNSNPARYGNGVNYEIYSFSAKYEQSVSSLWPSGDGTSFTLRTGLFTYRYYYWWGTAAEMGRINVAENMPLLSKRTVIDSSLLSADGQTQSYTFTLQTQAAQYTIPYRYLVEILEPDDPYDLERDGKRYIEMPEYSQNMGADGMFAKQINGLGPGSGPYRYNYNPLGSTKYIYSSTGEYRCFLYDRILYPFTFDPNLPAGADAADLSGMPANRPAVMFGAQLGYLPVGDPPVGEPGRVNPPPEIPALEGYSFAGWYKGADCVDAVDWSAALPTGGMTVFARWESSDHIVKFYESLSDLLNGTVLPYDVQGVADGGNAVNKASYYQKTTPGTLYSGKGVFLGWAFPISGRQAPFSFDITINRDYDVYAVWQTEGLSLVYDLDGGTCGEPPGSDPPVDPNTYELGTIAKVLGTDAVKELEGTDGATEEWVFYAWKCGDTLYYPGGFITVGADGELKLVAQYTQPPASYDACYKVIHYDADTGAVLYTDDLEDTVDTTVTAVPGDIPGYTYDPEDTRGILSGAITGDGTLVLKLYYRPNTYHIIYKANGGTGSMADTTATYNKNTRLRKIAFSRADHRFAGWNTQSSGKGTNYDNRYRFSPWKKTGNLTLYAQWTYTGGGSLAPAVTTRSGGTAPKAAPDEPPVRNDPPDDEPVIVPPIDMPPDSPDPPDPPDPVQIEDEPSPLADFAGWSLLNLLLTIATGAIMIVLLVTYFIGRNERPSRFSRYPKRKDTVKRHLWLRLATVAATAIAVILFILTEDMSLPMVLFDRWTMCYVILAAEAAILAFLSRKEYEKTNNKAPLIEF